MNQEWPCVLRTRHKGKKAERGAARAIHALVPGSGCGQHATRMYTRTVYTPEANLSMPVPLYRAVSLEMKGACLPQTRFERWKRDKST
jgi:hypothetical protein